MSTFTYYSTFISGFSDVVGKALNEQVKDVQIDLLLDGLVVYKTPIPPSHIKDIPFFNNSFYCIEFTKNNLPQGAVAVPHLKWDVSSEVIGNAKSFRIIISKENTLTSIPKQQLEKLEDQFAKKLNLDIDRANPDLEVWFLERREGYSFCGIRLTKKPRREKYLQKGELRPELAWLLCFLSKPSKSDVFVDPFAGYGSIPFARTQFPYSKIIATDTAAKNLEPKIRGSNIEIHNWDATHLPLEAQSIDKIVTDPPWGVFETKDIESLYEKMLKEFARILKPDGILVLLTAQKELTENLIAQNKNFTLKGKYNILVSGKKAGVYKIKKT